MDVKWFAIAMIGFFTMMAIGMWAENKGEASKIEACGKMAVELQKDCLSKVQ